MDEKKCLFKPIRESISDVEREGPIPFIWGGIKEGSFGFVYGPSKCGKTTFCENLAISLVCQKEMFLGSSLLQKEHRVLFLSLEEYKRQRSDRNSKQLQFLDPSNALINNLLVIEDDFPKVIRESADWERLDEIIKESKANVVFIDSLTRFGKGEIERSDTARQIAATLRDICHQNEITLVIIHHSPKLNGSPLTIDSLGGSHVFAQEADFLIGINKYNNVRYIKEVASRYKREDEEKVMSFSTGDDMWLKPERFIPESQIFRDNDNRLDDTNLLKVRELIKDNKNLTGQTNFKSIEIEQEAVKFMHRDTFYKKLKQLKKSNIIELNKKGEYSIIHDFSEN